MSAAIPPSPRVPRLRPREFRSRPPRHRTPPTILRLFPLIFRPLPLIFRHLPTMGDDREGEGALGERGGGDKISQGGGCPLRFCIAGREGSRRKRRGRERKTRGRRRGSSGESRGRGSRRGKPLSGRGEPEGGAGDWKGHSRRRAGRAASSVRNHRLDPMRELDERFLPAVVAHLQRNGRRNPFCSTVSSIPAETRFR